MAIMIPHLKYHCESQRNACHQPSTWLEIVKIQDRNYNCLNYIDLISTHISKQSIAISLTA